MTPQFTDGSDTVINGIRDLIDFFPLAVDLSNVINILPPSAGYTYALSSTSGKLNSFEGVIANIPLNMDEVAKPLEELAAAQAIVYQPVSHLSSDGVPISPTLITQMTNSPGIIYIEASAAEPKDSVDLQVFKGQTKVTNFSFRVSTSNVKDMFKQWDFRFISGGDSAGGRFDEPQNRPFCMDQTNKTLVWLHGYNVTAEAAQGTFAEVFKRLFHSGFNANFVGVAWFGDPPSPFGTSHYHEAVVNAFATSATLATFVNNLALSGQQVSITAHSLGNLVVGEAIQSHSLNFSKYFAVDASVALEAYGQIAVDNGMIHFDEGMGTDWQDYYSDPDLVAQKVLASEWYTLFPVTDSRRGLTWRNRLDHVVPTGRVYNFYSSTEDVLRAYPDDDVLSLIDLVMYPDSIKSYIETSTWVKQEKFKGRSQLVNLGGGSSPFCGWGYNHDYITELDNPDPTLPPTTPPTILFSMTVAEAAALAQDEETLKTNPFFNLGPGLENLGQAGNGNFVNQLVYQVPDLASYYQNNEPAQHLVKVRDWLLAEAFPATTLPMGANKNVIISDPIMNINMSDTMKTSEDEWPRLDTYITGVKDWRHGDYKDVPFQHTYKFYEKINELIK